MRESMRSTEAKYIPDRESSKDSDSGSDSSKDSDSSDHIVYVEKPKKNTNEIRCEDCNQELNQRNYSRHI